METECLKEDLKLALERVQCGLSTIQYIINNIHQYESKEDKKKVRYFQAEMTDEEAICFLNKGCYPYRKEEYNAKEIKISDALKNLQ